MTARDLAAEPLDNLGAVVVLLPGVTSIARFEELKKRAFAEYFPVGTLASVPGAIVLVAVLG